MEGYQDDLAYIHDVAFSQLAERAAPELLEILRRRGKKSGLVIDLGCGNGIWARKLLAAGYDAFGVDISSAMVELARRNAPGAAFEVGSYLQVRLPPCEAVTSIGQSLSYLFDEDHDTEAVIRLFRRIFHALRSGGVFAFDVYEAPRRRGTGRHRTWSEGEDWTLLIDAESEARQMTLQLTSFRRVGEHYRRHREVHRVKSYKSSEIAHELRRLGFRVRIVRGYGQYRFRPGHVGFIATKP